MAGTESKPLAASLAVLLAVGAVGVAMASDWKLRYGLGLSEHYSDNINLAPAGQEQSDLVTQVNPNFSLSRAGGRMSANVSYSLSALFYMDDPSRNNAQHTLGANATAELVKDFLFLDGTASISERAISLFGTPVDSPITSTANRTTVGTYSISPSIRHRFGSFGNFTGRLTQAGAFIETGASDATSNNLALAFTSGPDFQTVTWGVNYNLANVASSGVNGDSTTQSAAANAAFRVTQELSVTAGATAEKNNFSGAGSAADFNAVSLGVQYTPSRKLALNLAYNHPNRGSDFASAAVSWFPTERSSLRFSTTRRSFGRTYSLAGSHFTQRMNINLSYTEDFSSTAQQLLSATDAYLCIDSNNVATLILVPPGLVPPGNCSLVGIALIPSLVNETFLAKTLVGAVTYRLHKSSFTVSLANNRRELQVAGTTDEARSLTGSWNWSVAPKTNFALTAGLTRFKNSTGQDDDGWNVGARVGHQFQPKLSGALTVQHQERDASAATGDFKENSISASVNMTF